MFQHDHAMRTKQSPPSGRTLNDAEVSVEWMIEESTEAHRALCSGDTAGVIDALLDMLGVVLMGLAAQGVQQYGLSQWYKDTQAPRGRSRWPGFTTAGRLLAMGKASYASAVHKNFCHKRGHTYRNAFGVDYPPPAPKGDHDATV